MQIDDLCGLLEWVQDFGVEDRVDDWVDGWVEWRQALDECDESSVDSRKHLIYRKQVVHEIWAVTQDECWKGRTTIFYLVTRSATALKRDRVGRRERKTDRDRQTDTHKQTNTHRHEARKWPYRLRSCHEFYNVDSTFAIDADSLCPSVRWSRPLDFSFLPTSKNFPLNAANLTWG